MTSAPVTRGHGLLEGFLSRKRTVMANTLIGGRSGQGRILDIGCGSYPLFLEQANFSEKIGLDQVVNAARTDEWQKRGVTLVGKDLDQDERLPFPDGHFDVVTMLAVFEHIEKEKLGKVVSEIHRVLKPGGIYVVTTPASWADPILAILSWFGLLSSDEVDEHEETHTQASMADVLVNSGFPRENVKTGTFEMGMNLWAKAAK